MIMRKRVTTLAMSIALSICVAISGCGSSGDSSSSAASSPPDDGRLTSTVTDVSLNAFQYYTIFELNGETAVRCDITSDAICGLLKAGDTISYRIWNGTTDSPALQDVRRETRAAPR